MRSRGCWGIREGDGVYLFFYFIKFNFNGTGNPERLTIAGAVGHEFTSLWLPRITRNLTHDNRVYEVGRCHGGLTECAEFVFLNGHRFVLSLFPTWRAAAAGAGTALGSQQGVPSPKVGAGGVGVEPRRTRARQLGLGFGGGQG